MKKARNVYHQCLFLWLLLIWLQEMWHYELVQKEFVLVLVTACASGTHSIGEALRNIKHGYSDVIVAGGAECNNL